VTGREVEWSFHKDPDLIIEIWSTAAVLEAVVAALLNEPAKLKLMLERWGKKQAP
jgi:hypothetical protein